VTLPIDASVRGMTVRYAAAWALGHLRPSSPESKPDDGTTSQPKVIRLARPQYPGAAFDAKVQGTVLVDLLIGEDGEVAHAEVRRSIPGLDAAALECVRNWTFEPMRFAGAPRVTVARAPVTFRIF
jgi:TonB family protein